MKNLSKKWFATCLAIVLIVMPYLQVSAEEPAARNLSVFRVDGDEAFLARALGGRGVEPREGQRLNLGNVMQTGLDTQVYMQLDTASIVKQDELTYVAVSASGNLLSLSVLRGSALVDVAEMEPGQRLETRIGSTVMSVRGTLFTVSVREGGASVITMLSGEGSIFIPDETGAVVERSLEAGYVFWAHDLEAVEAFEFRPMDPRDMNLFELQEVLYRSDYLLEIGTITPAMQAQLQGLINQRQQERTTRLEARHTAISDFDTVASVTQINPPLQHITTTQPPQPLPISAQNQAMIGTIIPFGGFNWLVLDVQDNKALIITENVIFNRIYHHTLADVTWETSDIRRYLNYDFLSRFNLHDQNRIAATTVRNDDNQWLGSPGGNNTPDRIFLLSIEEVVRYFGDSGQLDNRPTNVWLISDEHDVARIARDLRGSASWWWLRSPGVVPSRAASVGRDGELNMQGGLVIWYSDIGGGIRPAMWLYM